MSDTRSNTIKKALTTAWGNKAFQAYYGESGDDYWTPYTSGLDLANAKREKKQLMWDFHVQCSGKISNPDELLKVVADAEQFGIAPKI